jgi:hypothetical protein
MAADCKSAAPCELRRFESSPVHQILGWQSMRLIESSGADAARERMMTEVRSSGSEMGRKYWVALALYAGLALLVWFTMSAGKVPIFGRPVDLRLVPLVVIGGLAARTVVARQAERIRRGTDSEGSKIRREQV